jgi:hypothetical protein
MSYADPARTPGNHISRDEAPQEPTGPVASDSLAAESTRAGGKFGENENPEILGVKGGQSTLNTTATSGASVLHPAGSDAERQKQDALGLGIYERGIAGVRYPEGAGQPEFDGSTNLDGYTGGPSSAKNSSGYDTTSASGGNLGAFDRDTKTGMTPDTRETFSSGATGNTTGETSFDLSDASGGDTSGASGDSGVRPYVDTAPTAQSGIIDERTQKPKGTNITEGGIPETKAFTGNVGGQYDPGRLAEQDFQNANANADRGAGEQATGEVEMTDKGGFEILDSERASVGI